MRNLITRQQVLDHIPYSEVQLWRKQNDPADDFPKPVQCGARRIAYYEDEVLAWIESRRRLGAAGQREKQDEPDDA